MNKILFLILYIGHDSITFLTARKNTNNLKLRNKKFKGAVAIKKVISRGVYKWLSIKASAVSLWLAGRILI